MSDERSQTREALLRAAVRKFAEQGFHGTKVADIVREAGVAQGTLYLYFSSKRDLLLALLERISEDLLAATRVGLAENRLASDDPARLVQAIAAVYRRVLRVLAEYSGVLRGLEGEMATLQAESEVFCRNRQRQIAEVADALRRSLAAGVFRSPVRVEVIVHVLMGSLVAAVEPRIRSGALNDPKEIDALAEDLAHLAVFGLLGERGAPQGAGEAAS